MLEGQDLLLAVEGAAAWCRGTSGAFSAYILGKECALEEPSVRNQIIAELVDMGVIEAVGHKHGQYVLCDDDAPVMDWQNAAVEEYPLRLPLGLSERVIVSPGNVIVVAGEKNAGKTTFALRIAYENLRQNGGQHDVINHFDYESHPAELKARLMGICHQVEAWDGFIPKKRLGDFHKVLDPDGLNIIDYLKIGGTKAAFFEAGALFERIHAALGSGVAIVLVQKKKGEEFARGGELTTEEARLAISLFSESGLKWARVTKCKFPRQYPNPEGMETDYKIVHGAVFEPVVGWEFVSHRERERRIKEAESHAIMEEMKRKNEMDGDRGPVW